MLFSCIKESIYPSIQIFVMQTKQINYINYILLSVCFKARHFRQNHRFFSSTGHLWDSRLLFHKWNKSSQNTRVSFITPHLFVFRFQLQYIFCYILLHFLNFLSHALSQKSLLQRYLQKFCSSIAIFWNFFQRSLFIYNSPDLYNVLFWKKCFLFFFWLLTVFLDLKRSLL